MIPHQRHLRAVRGFSRARYLSVSALLLACGLAACGRVPGQFTIINNQVPTETCEIPVNDAIYQGQGRLDLRLVRSGAESAFYVFPLMQNNLAASGEGPDPNRITLTSFAVDISVLTAPTATTQLINSLNGDGATSALLHYKTPWSGSIDSGGGKLSAWVAAFPVELASRILATHEVGVSPSVYMNLKIRAFGSTLTQDIESDPLDYPVAVCDGCLIARTQPCPFMEAPLFTGNPCNVAQDALVDCCTAGNDLVCPPVVSP